MVQQNPIIEELRQEVEQLKQEIKENSEKQKPVKKETKEFEIQTEGEVQDLYDKGGTYLKTELLPPKTGLSETRVNTHGNDNSKKGPGP